MQNCYNFPLLIRSVIDSPTAAEDRLGSYREHVTAFTATGLVGAKAPAEVLAWSAACSVDLLAEDASGHPVVAENQLGRSDHDHLGKVITYLTAFDAQAAVWVVADPRPEHVQAVAWLNESTSASFYLVKVEAVRIGTSPPAPLFTLIVGPSEEAREVGRQKRALDEKQKRYVVDRRQYPRSRLATFCSSSPCRHRARSSVNMRVARSA